MTDKLPVPTPPPAPPPPPALPPTQVVQAAPPQIVPPNIEARRKSNLPTRVPRRPEEAVPGPDYVSRLEALGPRNGESFLAFKKRMYMIAGVRQLWIDTWRTLGGDRISVAQTMGIPANNISNELRAAGLTAELLFDIVSGKVKAQ